jgi:ABC-type transporter Mla subunit MlaD
MARQRKVTIPSDGQLDEAQGTLVPMTETELQEAGRTLAGKVKELRDLKTNHAGARSEMKKQREDVQKDIDRIAGTIRQQGR